MLPPGYKFRPSDEEAISFYLDYLSKGKQLHPFCPIVHRNLFGENNPWNILSDNDPWEYTFEGGSTKKIIYVYSKLVALGKTRYVRTSKFGTWSEKAAKNKINNSNGDLVGHNKYYTYVPAKNDLDTKKYGNWSMHEYSFPNNRTGYVLCKVTVEDFNATSSDMGIDDGLLGNGKRKSSTSLDDGGSRKMCKGSGGYGTHDDNLKESHSGNMSTNWCAASTSTSIQTCKGSGGYGNHDDSLKESHSGNTSSNWCYASTSPSIESCQASESESERVVITELDGVEMDNEILDLLGIDCSDIETFQIPDDSLNECGSRKVCEGSGGYSTHDDNLKESTGSTSTNWYGASKSTSIEACEGSGSERAVMTEFDGIGMDKENSDLLKCIDFDLDNLNFGMIDSLDFGPRFSDGNLQPLNMM